ncbi:Phage protein D [Rubrivivax sp. A210]|uniref:phage late control D family protein n=1 Tax=Rubrivivax sp. A210 TaxID=2772301 RepID=UPI00191A484D|nr:hypothetical protein [Rubrivivax sp. A210]CAD5366036.1 Phage protein D [Rubrivivax sp. A210]
MALSRPYARLTVDGQALGADESGLVRLKLALAGDGGHDSAQLVLWPGSKFADAAPGATVTIALGERDDETEVFAGELQARSQQPQQVVLDALAATLALSRGSKSQAFLNQSVADIVRDLAGEVQIDQALATLKLPAWHVDNRRPLWRHLQDLARLVDADLCSAADGSLRFVPAGSPAAPTLLRYGADLLDWRLSTVAEATPAAVAAAGAGSEQGEARWHWLRHDPVGAGAGPTLLPAGLASSDGAQGVADGLSARAKRSSVRGELLLPGRPALRPGDVVQLQDLPGGDPGALRVRAVLHTLDGASGFLTRLRVEGAPS